MTDRGEQALVLWQRVFGQGTPFGMSEVYDTELPWRRIGRSSYCIFCGRLYAGHQPDCIYYLAERLVLDND